MKRIFSSLQRIEFLRHVLPALLLGASLGVFLHGYWLTDLFPIGSKSLLFFTVLISLIGTAGYILLFLWLNDGFSSLSNIQKAGMIGLSLLFGAFLFFTVTDNWQKPARYISLFLPTHTLEISIPPDQNVNEISILWITTSLGDPSYDSVAYSGWELIDDRLVLADPSDNQFHWKGKIGEEFQIVFESSSRNGVALLELDGQEDVLQFSKKKTTYVRTFNIPFLASSRLIVLLGILNFSFFLLPLCLLIWTKREELLPSIQQGFSGVTRPIDQREWILLFILIGLAFLLRAPNLEILFPSVEEYDHINAAKQIIQGVSIEDVYQRSLWLVTLPVSIMFRVFGYKLWAARLVGIVFNVLAVIPLYFIARKINWTVAILSVLLYATSPWVIAISRVMREYAYYPFYYFWIIYAMVLLLEKIPLHFHASRDWKIVLNLKTLALIVILVLPPLYAFWVDILSTFKLIMIAYAVLGLFIVFRLDFRDRNNLFLIVFLAGMFLIGSILVYRQFPLHLSVNVNLTPLSYFFMNPLQQIYFERITVIPLIGFLGAVVVAVLLRRVNSIPLFLLTLYIGFLGFFMFLSSRFFTPRHLSTTHLWYIMVVAMGLYVLWVFLQTFSFLKQKRIKVLTALLGLAVIMNVQQVLVPITSKSPYMPITQIYHNDMTKLQAYMLAYVREEDVLISSRTYTRYLEWAEEPIFEDIYSFSVNTTKDQVFSIVGQYESGWIVIDNARIQRAAFSPEKAFLDNDRIEYVGLFEDQHVWRWGAE